MRQAGLDQMDRARVANPGGLVAAGLLGLGLGLAAATAVAAESPAPTETADAEAMRPLILCTAPWPPFVENVPPPLPPAARPDPLALGFTPPDAEDADDADDAPDGETGADTPARPLPPSPPPIETRVAAADAADPDADPAPMEVATRAFPVAGPPAVPLTGAAVAPPLPPLTKSLGRILAAREAVEVSTTEPVPGPAEAGEPPATEEADSAVDAPPGAPSEAAPERTPEATPEPTAEAAPVDQEAPVIAALPPGPSAGTEADGPPRPEAAPPTETVDSADPLTRLRMPRARALLPQGRPGGPITEAVVAACKAADLPCRISLLPWLRPADVLASGRCDGVFPIEPTTATRPFMVASKPLVETRLAFFTLDTSITAVDAFTDFIVLARGPSGQAHHAHRAVEGLEETRLVFGPDLTRLIARLGTLRPDDRVALFGNYHVVTRAMAAVEGSIPALSVVPAGTQRLHVGFSRDRVPGPVVRAFDQGLRRIAETRELQEILDLGGLEPIN